jgi:phospholipid/cholesterol/gamma-HCH transport system substrate-binding protein
MESRAHAILAGLFTLALGVGIIVAAMWLSREEFDHVSYVLESKYSVSGLGPQAPVRLRGVPIGKVLNIEFDPENQRLILITIIVRAGSHITRGTTARLNAQGITGTSYVMLEDDGKNVEFLPPSTDRDKRIVVKQSLIEEVAGSGQEILYEARQAARQLNLLLAEENRTKVMDMVVSLQGATDRLSALARSLEPGTRAVPALAGDARKALASADAQLREFGPTLQAARSALEESKGALASIDKLAREYTRQAGALDRVAKSAGDMSGATQGAANAITEDIAPRLNALLEELSRTSRNLDRLLTELNEQPAGLVFGKPSGRPGPGEPGYVGRQ